MIGYPYYPQQYPQQTQQSGFVWVNNEKEVDNYLVAPNAAVALWDRNEKRIYVKTADASGMTSVKHLRYTIDEEAPTERPQYVTMNDLQTLAERVAKLEKGEKE